MPKPKIKAVFFDMGGVIVSNVSDPWFALAGKLLRTHPKKVAEAWQRFSPLLHRGLVSYRVCFRMIGDYCGLPGIPPKLVRKLSASYSIIAKADRKVLAMIRALRRRKIFIGLISNTHAKNAAINFRRGIFRDFNVTIFSYRVGLLKPDPTIFRLALLKTGFRPDETVLIDDNPKYVAAAEKLGMAGIVFRGARDLRRQLVKLGLL